MRDLLTVWSAFNPIAIDDTWPAIERSALSIIAARRSESAALSQTYYVALREESGLRAALPLVSSATEWEQAARVSLLVTGPVGAKEGILAKRPLADIVDNTFVRVAGVVQRHALNGGRATLIANMLRDRVRYRRVTSGRACDFCVMLAGRGAVYAKDTSDFRSHDHCHCTAEPVFR